MSRASPQPRSALTGTQEQLCMCPHSQQVTEYTLALPSTRTTVPALPPQQPEPPSKAEWKLPS